MLRVLKMLADWLCSSGAWRKTSNSFFRLLLLTSGAGISNSFRSFFPTTYTCLDSYLLFDVPASAFTSFFLLFLLLFPFLHHIFPSSFQCYLKKVYLLLGRSLILRSDTQKYVVSERVFIMTGFCFFFDVTFFHGRGESHWTEDTIKILRNFASEGKSTTIKKKLSKLLNTT